MTRADPRPWYCHSRLTDDYIKIANSGGDLRMLKTLKIVRSIIVNLGIIGVSAYSLLEGADPTWVGIVGIVTLGLYNGVEVADYAALAQAFVEAKDSNNDGGE
jgi:hypothetical protein